MARLRLFARRVAVWVDLARVAWGTTGGMVQYWTYEPNGFPGCRVAIIPNDGAPVSQTNPEYRMVGATVATMDIDSQRVLMIARCRPDHLKRVVS